MLKFIELIEKEVPQDDSADIGEKMFLYGLIRGINPSVVVETGTHRGKTSLYMAQALYDNEGDGHLHTADPFDWGARGNFRKIPELEKLITFYDKPGKDVKVKEIDLLFIDGFHEKEHALDEFNAHKDNLTENAIVVFHDCHYGAEPNADVNGAVEELGIKTVYIPSVNRMRIYEKSEI